jgi:hypothetical protein
MEHKERWQQLCDQAKDEQNSEKLMELVEEIIRILDGDDWSGSPRYIGSGPGSAQRFLH